MIEIQKAKKEFKKYVSDYDVTNDKIRIKIGHIERTANIAKEIATNKNLPEEEMKLAWLIGLLHDIGRFEQVKRYNTFIDKDSINHGEFGAKLLFEQGMIRKFIEDDQYDEIIKKAILNHNRSKQKIEVENDRELLHSKIIRDADKIDIIYMLSFENKETAFGSKDIEKEKMTEEIYEQFMKNQEIDYEKRKNAVDVLVSHFAYVFDFNDKHSLSMINEKGYFDKIYQRFQFKDQKTQEKVNQIYKVVKKFLDESSYMEKEKINDRHTKS